jgi:hypothetical protein
MGEYWVATRDPEATRSACSKPDSQVSLGGAALSRRNAAPDRPAHPGGEFSAINERLNWSRSTRTEPICGAARQIDGS